MQTIRNIVEHTHTMPKYYETHLHQVSRGGNNDEVVDHSFVQTYTSN
jgi:hypothetical protein